MNAHTRGSPYETFLKQNHIRPFRKRTCPPSRQGAKVPCLNGTTLRNSRGGLTHSPTDWRRETEPMSPHRSGGRSLVCSRCVAPASRPRQAASLLLPDESRRKPSLPRRESPECRCLIPGEIAA